MFKKLFYTASIVLLFASFAVAGEKVAPAERLKQRIAAAKEKIHSIDSTTLKTWLEDEEKSILLVDVRGPEEISAGKIEADDYMAIPRGLLEFKFSRKVTDLNTPVVVYCLKGSRGALAVEALNELGYTNVYNLQGGLLDWIGAGHPVSNFLGEFELENFDSNFAGKS